MKCNCYGKQIPVSEPFEYACGFKIPVRICIPCSRKGIQFGIASEEGGRKP